MADLNRYLMDQILLENGEFTNYQVEGLEGAAKPKRLENLGKINVFVGANNSGKSRLIRAIARNPNNVYEPPQDLRPKGVPSRDLHRIRRQFLDNLFSIRPHYSDHALYRNQIESLFKDSIYPGLSLNPHQGSTSFQIINDKFKEYLSSQARYIPGWNDEPVISLIQSFTDSLNVLQACEEAGNKSISLYIPTLRSLRDLKDKDRFKQRTMEDYKLGKVVVFTGQTLCEEVESLLRGNLTNRRTLRDFEKWLGENFFENQDVALIPKKDDTSLTIKIGEEQEKPIHELGDGIQSILILTFELFRHADEHVLAFIEEPELFLHPWLQRVFLEVLAKKFPKHQYFLTTHSNHFLDMTLDVENVSIFLLEKKLDEKATELEKTAQFIIHPLSRDDRKPLETLGVRNSSVLLSNCTIWVEGITDRRYIAHWLELYNNFEGSNQEGGGSHKVFKEDLHYSFMEYAGACITHYSFLDDDIESSEKTKERKINVDWLCGRLFLITDQDGVKIGSKKATRQSRLADKLGDHYYCLKAREIENLITPDVLIKVLQAYGEEAYSAPAHKDYEKIPLGTFIDEFLNQDTKRKQKKQYADKPSKVENTNNNPQLGKKKRKTDGYTIQRKSEFCQYAIEATKTWSDLSDEAQELTRKLYAFIQSKNT